MNRQSSNALNKEHLSRMLKQVSTGKAVLFTGAGFSFGTKNIHGNGPPNSKELAKKISDLGSFENEEQDLRFATDYYLANNNKADFIKLLKDTYTLQEVGPSQISICSIRWKRCYTTNYDNSIELASAKSGILKERVDITDSRNEHYKKADICIHLNGSIDSLNEESIENRFKLTTSSYISSDTFVNSDWNYAFKTDLERSSAIVFVGYSMYDIEIQKILYDNKKFKEKTYFITSPNTSQRDFFTLSKFGYVIPIGVDALAQEIEENREIFQNEPESNLLESFIKYEISDQEKQIRDKDVHRFLMYGDLDKIFIDDGVLSNQKLPYLILREFLEKSEEFAKKKKNVIITGNFGNGKTIFLSELACLLSYYNHNTYILTDPEGDYIKDLETLSKSKHNSFLIIDGYSKYIDFIEYYSSILPQNITLIISARTAEHEQQKYKLNELKFTPFEIDLDVLNDGEIEKLVEVIDNAGFWGDKAGWSKRKKLNFIKNDNNSQISRVLLTLFDSPNIKDKVNSLFTKLFENTDFKDTVFALALISVLDLNTSASFVSEVALNNSIFSSSLYEDIYFKQVFNFSGNRILNKSSLFSHSLIKNHFSPSYTIKQYQRILSKFDQITQREYAESKIFKSLLRFSFVERSIPDENKKSNLLRYYEELKVLIPWLKYDTHFWLQYGMANIMFNELLKAQSFFDQAYSIAQSKENYHTNQLDTQQARLFILQALETSNSTESFNYFQRGHNLLVNLDNDIHKFRQISSYKDIYDKKYAIYSKKQKNLTKEYFNLMTSAADKTLNKRETSYRDRLYIEKVMGDLKCSLEDFHKT